MNWEGGNLQLCQLNSIGTEEVVQGLRHIPNLQPTPVKFLAPLVPPYRYGLQVLYFCLDGASFQASLTLLQVHK